MNHFNNVAIFYFSGTGNTKLLAEQYTATLRQLGVNVDLWAIEEFISKKLPLEIAKYDAIGIGYPVHAFSAPHIVFQFMRLLPAGGGLAAFLFKCPGDMFANGGSTLPVRRRLMRKGYEVVHESMLVMPANFSVLYPPALAKELYSTAGRRIKVYAQELLNGKKRLQHNTISEKMWTLLAPFEQLGARMMRLLLYTRSTCNGCGSCTRKCPAQNIMIKNRRPTFGWHCLACLRCVYQCPQKAINIRVLGFLLFKDGYDIRRTIADKNTPDSYTGPKMDGYFHRFYAYTNDPEYEQVD